MMPQQEKLLETLANVQYCTLKQMISMGIYNSQPTAYRHTQELKKQGLITSLGFGLVPTIGKLPDMYGLLPKGANYLVNSLYIPPDKIKVSKSHSGRMQAPRDFFHREGVIWVLLKLYEHTEAIDATDVFSEIYFRKYGMNDSKRTQIQIDEDTNLEPDAIFCFSDAGKQRLYLIEHYEDSEQVERIRKSLQRHAVAIGQGSPSLALGVHVGHRVLCVFRHEHTARAVIQYLASDPIFAQIKNRFLCVTLDALKADVFNQWATPDHTKTTLY